MEEKSRIEFIKYRWICLITGVVFLFIWGLVGLTLIGCSIAGFILSKIYPKKRKKIEQEKRKRAKERIKERKRRPKL